MVSRLLVFILAGCFGGATIVMSSMLMAEGGEAPGSYTGTHNAANAVSDSSNCNSFDTGCTNSHYSVPKSDMDSGAYLSGNYKAP